ncbi:hypothetical protein [Flavobacterium fluviatile]|uniref:glycoside hydrolase family 78 protein n=1 Tax=Flavobacterium fluviatile TaxID=1862387 RepID=UPI001FCCBBA5|nr:hypothetical protein [Flavobacterium fluviatile]
MKNLKNIFYLFLLLVTFISNGQISAEYLTCEMAENPLAVNTNQPRLSWQLVSKEFYATQIGYQILVSSSEEKLKNGEGDIWNSGRVNSEKNLQIIYSGTPLKSETKYFWKVKVWNQKGKASNWSKIASFRMSPSASDLNPVWIGAITKTNSHLPQKLPHRHFQQTEKRCFDQCFGFVVTQEYYASQTIFGKQRNQRSGSLHFRFRTL